jgi:AhpD family alkylhydroperoxidase
MTNEARGKPLFSPAESYCIFYQAIRTAPYMLRGEKQGLMSPALRERLMMAVTEVNGCAMCSWYHVRVALETGLEAEEIHRMLAGELRDVPDAEITAVLFARHYADTRGKPDSAAWDKLKTQYGKDAALAMLGAIRGIMLGNAIGIPAGSLLRRFGVKRFRTDPRSTLFYELAVLLSGVVFMPIALLHAIAARALRLQVEP